MPLKAIPVKLVLCFLLFVNTAIYAKVCVPQEFDKKLFTSALQEFKKTPVIPKFAPYNVGIPSTSPDVTLPEDIVSDFNKIESPVFGKPQRIRLKACTDKCEALASAEDNTVYLDPKFVEEIKRDFPKSWRAIMRFILAHEVSHFVHEGIARKQASGLGPQGNPPILGEHPANNLDEIKKKDPDHADFRIGVRCGKSHVEVDGLALIILEELGHDDAPAAQLLLTDLLKKLPPTGPGRIDTVFRIDNLKKTFLPRGIRVKAECTLSEDEEVNQWLSLEPTPDNKKTSNANK